MANQNNKLTTVQSCKYLGKFLTRYLFPFFLKMALIYVAFTWVNDVEACSTRGRGAKVKYGDIQDIRSDLKNMDRKLDHILNNTKD